MKRHSCKFVLVVLAIPALAVASRGFAQQSSGPSDGLYALPDAGRSAGTAQESAGDRSAQSYLSSLDPRGEQFKRDLEKAEETQKAVASAKRLKYLVEEGDTTGPLETLGLSERTWIALLAGLGLLVSLAAGGYVWWSRMQSSRASAAVLLAIKPEPAAKPDSPAEHDKTTKRRAA